MTMPSSLLTEAIQVLPHIFMHDLLRYLIGAGGIFLVINGLLRHALAGRRIREARPGWRQVGREILASLRTVGIFSGVGLTIWLCDKAGFARFHDDPAQYGWLWFWASVIILIIAHDAWFYWTHRLIHHPRLFRRMHRLHHRSNNPTPFTAYAFDWQEAVINAVYLLLIGFIMPVSFLAAFVFTAHMMLRNALGHCGYEVFPRTREGQPLFGWLTTVTHHDIHHAEAGHNYGLYFTFWDRALGTEHPAYLARFAAAVRKTGGPNESASVGRAFNRAPLAFLFATALAGLAGITPPAGAQSQPQDASRAIAAIQGDWATEGYGAVVRLRACGEDGIVLCGELVWVWDERDLVHGEIGMLMLTGFSYTDGKWRGGRLTNPVDGRTYRGDIRQVGNDLIDLTGCAARVICHTQAWRRLSSLPHAAPGGA